MNFLGHLLLAEYTATSMPGAILGDMVRGRDFEQYPADIALGIRLHRRLDTLTDQHPSIRQAVRDYPADGRRYAPVLLDLVVDYCLVQAWPQLCDEVLDTFSDRAGERLAAAGPWFLKAGSRSPVAAEFSLLLRSYGQPQGIERAIVRTAGRLQRPQPMLDAAQHWRRAAKRLQPQVGALIGDLTRGATEALQEFGGDRTDDQA